MRYELKSSNVGDIPNQSEGTVVLPTSGHWKKSLLYSVEPTMKRLRLSQKVIRSMVIAATACALAYEIVTVSSQYYKWSVGLLDRGYHEDYPLGRTSVWGLHFGACFTDVQNGGYAMYCDGLPQGKEGFGVIPNTKVFGAGHSGCALSLCTAFGGESVLVLVPLPNFELP